MTPPLLLENMYALGLRFRLSHPPGSAAAAAALPSAVAAPPTWYNAVPSCSQSETTYIQCKDKIIKYELLLPHEDAWPCFRL